MTSINDLRQQILDPALSNDERALLRCQLSKQLTDLGDYDAAQDALGNLWVSDEAPPKPGELELPTLAEVLLRVGALMGWMGSSREIEGSEDLAKNLINEGLSIFKSLRDARKVAEAETELGYCYLRAGELEDARVMFTKARTLLDERDPDLKAAAILRCVALERQTKRLHEALNLLEKTGSLFEAVEGDGLKASFHNEFANVLNELGKTERRTEYLDRALSEYAAASFYFQKAGYTHQQADAEMDQARLLLTFNKPTEAHGHLDRAASLLVSPDDDVQLAQLRSLRAKVFLAEGDFVNAEKMAGGAVELLEKECAPLLSGEQAEVDDPLDLVVARWPENLSRGEMREFVSNVSDLLKNSRDRDLSEPNIKWARHFLGIYGFGEPDWTSFSFEQTLHHYEQHYIRRALEDAGGLISQAAYFLSVRRHQLRYMLKKHHRNLLELVTAEDQEDGIDLNDLTSPEDEAIRILHIGKDLIVTATLQEMAQREGWKLYRSGNGKKGLEKLAVRDGKYDLLILDYELPKVRGLEFIASVRAFFHLRSVPIVVLSNRLEDEAPAREAGADAFLRKREDLGLLPQTINRIFDLECEL